MPRSITDIDRKISLRFSKIRKEQGHTLEDIANYLELSFQQVQKYEKGINRIGISNLYKLCSLFNVDLNYFLALDDITDKDVERALDLVKRFVNINPTENKKIAVKLVNDCMAEI